MAGAQRAGLRRTTPSRAAGPRRICGPGSPSRGSTRPASCSPSRPGPRVATAAHCSASTGPRCTAPGPTWRPAYSPGPPAAHIAGDHAHDPIGEVYVLGVDPAAHGTGLGTGADPRRAAPSARPRPGPGDALRRRVQQPGRALYERTGFRPLVHGHLLPPRSVPPGSGRRCERRTHQRTRHAPGSIPPAATATNPNGAVYPNVIRTGEARHLPGQRQFARPFTRRREPATCPPYRPCQPDRSPAPRRSRRG